jgi:hypothetical protein
MTRRAIKCLFTRFGGIEAMLNGRGDRTSSSRVFRIGGREIVAEGQQLSF